MKKGSIILSAAALGATIVSAFAFKPANLRHQLFASVFTALGVNKVCLQCKAWTLSGSGVKTVTKCITINSTTTQVTIPQTLTNHRHPLFTQKTVNGKCKTSNFNYTLVN